MIFMKISSNFYFHTIFKIVILWKNTLKQTKEISQDRPKKVFVTNIDLKTKNDQNRLKCSIKRSKYTFIPLGLINLDIKV